MAIPLTPTLSLANPTQGGACYSSAGRLARPDLLVLRLVLWAWRQGWTQKGRSVVHFGHLRLFDRAPLCAIPTRMIDMVYQDDHHSFIFTSPLDGPPSAPVAPKQMFAISFPKPNIVSVIDPVRILSSPFTSSLVARNYTDLLSLVSLQPTNLTPMILQAIRDAAREGGGVSEEGWILGTQRNIGGGPTAGGAYRFKLKGYTKWYMSGLRRFSYVRS